MVLQSVVLPMPLRPTTDEHAAVERQRHALNGVALAVIDLKVLDLAAAGASALRSAMPPPPR